MPSRVLNDKIKLVLRKIIAYHPSDKFPLDRSVFADIRITWQNLWQIKDPTLRAIRHKILLKDIWCQEKRFKLGISNSSSCTICGENESALHQLFLCNNAKRIWNLALGLMGVNPRDFQFIDQSIANLIEVSNNVVNEIIKSAVFKLLIQIDRSHKLDPTSICRSIAYWININLKFLSKRTKGNSTLANLLKSMLHKLNLSQ